MTTDFNPDQWRDFVGIESPEDLAEARAEAAAWLWQRLEYRHKDRQCRALVRLAVARCRELSMTTIAPRPKHYRYWPSTPMLRIPDALRRQAEPRQQIRQAPEQLDFIGWVRQ